MTEQHNPTPAERDERVTVPDDVDPEELLAALLQVDPESEPMVDDYDQMNDFAAHQEALRLEDVLRKKGMKQDAINQWWKNAAPELQGWTPVAVWNARRFSAVRSLVEST
jgi:hypothetical protein